jgi:adenosylcobinamide-GDP ribazoletransferase
MKKLLSFYISWIAVPCSGGLCQFEQAGFRRAKDNMRHQNIPLPILDTGRALALLTRLPVPHLPNHDRTWAMSAWAWPWVGVVIGLAQSCVLALGLPAVVAAGLVLALGVILTGALHEDGLADCADGFWGGMDPTRRMEIMKDSRIGSYGVLATVLIVGLNWAALVVLSDIGLVVAGLVTAAAISRFWMGVVMLMRTARDTGLSLSTGQPTGRIVLIAGAGALAVSVVFGTLSLAVIVLPALVALGAAAIARAKIGGQTGDVLGATQQLTYTATLIALL